jgi:hypothetical protein
LIVPKKLSGIRQHGNQWEVRIMVRGVPHLKFFPLDTPTATMRAWQDAQRRVPHDLPASRGSFRADVLADLPRIEASPTYEQQKAHLLLWVDVLGGDRPTASITTAEIDAAIQRMLLSKPTRMVSGKRREKGETVRMIIPAKPGEPRVSPDTIRKQRTHLRGFFRRWGGDAAVNPVDGTTIPESLEHEALGLDYRDIERILAAMPETRSAQRPLARQWGRRQSAGSRTVDQVKADAMLAAHAKGQSIREITRAMGVSRTTVRMVLRSANPTEETGPMDTASPNLSKHIAEVLAYTGAPPALLKMVEPEFVQLGLRRIQFPPRKKGQGAAGRTLPLTDDGVAAFKRFAAAGVWGSTWPKNAVNVANRSFQRACAAVADECVAPEDVRRATMYWLRHSFGYFLYETKGDLETVRRMMMLETLAMAARYAKRATEAVDRAAAAHMSMRLKALRDQARG